MVTPVRPAPVRTTPAPQIQRPGPTARAVRLATRQAVAGPPAVSLGSSPPVGAGVSPQLTRLVNAPGPGDPLPIQTRRSLEDTLIADLSPVRVHADARTAAIVDAVPARALTYGTHIFLGRGERPTDLGLMAHETAHVVQQRGAPVLQLSSGIAYPDAFEQEAHQTSMAAQRGERAPVAQRTNGARIQAQEIQQGEGWLERRMWGLLNDYAPELVPILRQGILEWLKARIGRAIQVLFDELSRPVRAIREVVAVVTAHFRNLLAWMREAAIKIAHNDCSPIAEAAQRIEQVFIGLVSPIVDRIKDVAARVRAFFSGLWERFGAPVWDFLRRVAGEQWAQIQQVGRWLWEKTQPIRDWLSAGWRRFKNWLGIGEGPEGQNGILQWVQAKASQAWEWLAPRIAPFRRPLMIVAGVLLLLSPAGPIIVIAGAAAGILRGVQWIRENFRNTDGIVRQQGLLRGIILPGILNTITLVGGIVQDTANRITGALSRAVGGVNEMAAAVSSTPILSFASGIISYIADSFRGLLSWATESVQGLAGSIQNGLTRLGRVSRMMVDFLEEVARVVRDMLRIVYFVAGRIWNAIPACIRDPFIDFFIPLILRQISFFRELASTPEAWAQTRADVMRLIRQFFRDFDLWGAMRTIFRLLLRALRVPVDLALQVLQKAAQAWDVVLARPIQFLINLLRAMGAGFRRFFGNILSHLWYGIQGWIFNQLEDMNISPPASWTDLRAIFGFVLQVLGISLDHVLELLATRVGRPVVDRIRRVISFLSGAWEWVRVAITEGPAGLWRMLVERLRDLGRSVLEAAVGWVMGRIIAIVSARITALFASAGLSAVLEAFIAIYRAIQTAIEYARRILQILNTVFDTILQIAQGVFGPAAEMMERGLRMAMPIVIGFLANYIGLGGLGERLREIIRDVRARVDAAILWLIDRALAGLQWLMNLLRSAAQAVLEWWRSRFRFSDDDGTPHEVYFQGTEESNQLMVASTPVAIDTFLDDAQTRTNAMTDPTEKQRRNDAISVARDTLAELDRVTYRRSGRPPAGVTIEERVVSGLLRRLADKLRILMRDTSDRPVPRILVVPGFSATKASQLEVRYLFNGPGNHDDGTPASTYGGDLSGALPILVSLGVRTDWVAFHILNENTGGLAVDSNLIPAPRDTNTEYLDEFEEPHLKHEHDNGSVVWMEARFDYRTSEGFPEFIRTYTARGGIMRWVSGSSLWERNPSADFPTFRRTMDLPRASAILINLLPLSTSPADERIRSLATRGTAMTANTLELITRWRRAHGAPIVWNKDYLIRYYSWAVEEFDPARTSGRRTNDQFGIDNADIDYRPR